MNNKYIDKRNTIALHHFKELGVELKEGDKNTYLCCSQCNPDPISTLPVYYISGGGFDEMSGRQFSRYLKRNNLLYTFNN